MVTKGTSKCKKAYRQVLIKYTRLSVLCGTYCYNPQENTFVGTKECKTVKLKPQCIQINKLFTIQCSNSFFHQVLISISRCSLKLIKYHTQDYVCIFNNVLPVHTSYRQGRVIDRHSR